MAQPTNTYDSYDAVGNREDLADVIYNISPTATPFQTMAKRAKATNILHEWQTDSLASASTSNAVIDGDDATTDAMVATTRLNNRTQISDKVVLISGSQEAANTAGRKSEMAYQTAKSAKELKRDMEAILTGSQAKVAGNSTTARKAASLESWIKTNSSFGAGGADPTGDGSDTRTDGTQRVIIEDMSKEELREAFASGGEPNTLMVGPFNKQKVSGFTGGATRMDKSEDMKLYAAIDVYRSDFGEVKVVPNRFQRDRTAFPLQSDMWAIAYYRPFRSHELAKTGDSQRRQILVEYTLEARQEASSGVIADLLTT